MYCGGTPASGFQLSPSAPHLRRVLLFFFFFNKVQMSSALNCRECGIDLIKVSDD